MILYPIPSTKTGGIKESDSVSSRPIEEESMPGEKIALGLIFGGSEFDVQIMGNYLDF